MRKCFALICMTMVLTLTCGAAMADSIKGKIGITGRGGFLVPAESKFTAEAGVPAGVSNKIDSDTTYAFGGGFIFGLTDNIAAELDVTYSKADAEFIGVKFAENESINTSVGLQYRFMPSSKFVPYIGAGVDLLINDVEYVGVVAGAPAPDVDTTVGGHLSIGMDLFLTSQIALNAEFKGVLAAEADVKDKPSNIVGAKYDPSSVSGLFGIRFFFN